MSIWRPNVRHVAPNVADQPQTGVKIKRTGPGDWTRPLKKGRERVAWNQALTYDMIYTQPVVHEFGQIAVPTALLSAAGVLLGKLFQLVVRVGP